MGSTFSPGSEETSDLSRSQLKIKVVGVEPIERVDIVVGGIVVDTIGCNLELECRIDRTFSSESLEGYLYVRVVQVDGGAAWSSPFFFD
jgi:hypothetical protein